VGVGTFAGTAPAGGQPMTAQAMAFLQSQSNVFRQHGMSPLGGTPMTAATQAAMQQQMQLVMLQSMQQQQQQQQLAAQAAAQGPGQAGAAAQRPAAVNPLSAFVPAAGGPGTNALAQYALMAQLAAFQSQAASRAMAAQAQAGDQPPPAKRQAMDATTYAAALQQMLMAGNFTTQQIAQIAARQRAMVASLPPAQQASAQQQKPARGNMRVQIDKRNRAQFDGTFVGEDTTAKDHADHVVRKCEEISKALKSHLGSTGDDERFGAIDSESARYQQVSQAQLIDACGDSARYLKPYQIVGVNFLTLLYKTRIGGAILADEM
jgi:hypothetical protein